MPFNGTSVVHNKGKNFMGNEFSLNDLLKLIESMLCHDKWYN